MRLIFLISSMGGGGAERVTANLANYWVSRGWEVTIVTFTAKTEDFYQLNYKIKRIEIDEILIHYVNNFFVGFVRNLYRVYKVRQVLNLINPQVAISMMTTANILLALSGIGMKFFSLGSERTFPPKYPLGYLWERLRKFLYRLLDIVVAQSSECAQWLITNTTAKKVIVIPNPVKWPLLEQEPLVPIDTICREGRKILLAVGRLCDEKQFGLLISIFQKLAILHSEWDLIILGEGPLRDILERQIEYADLVNRVYLPGRVGNIGDWYSNADLFVLSSKFEGFPNSLLEAMAYGLPPVSFDCDTGPRDIIDHFENGVLVKDMCDQGLFDALNLLMGNEALRLKLAEHAKNVRHKFSFEVLARKWEALFCEASVEI